MVSSRKKRTFITSSADTVRAKPKKGVRKVKQFISQPLVSKTEITERQNLVQFLVDSAEVRNNLSQSILQKIPDIGKINIRISQMQQSENIGARVALAELARVNLACKKIPAILELLRSVLRL